MSLRTHGLKALGLSFLAAVSLMAIGAAGAGAVAGKFLINGSTAALTSSFTVEVDLLGVLLIPGITLEIDCLKFNALNGTLTTNTGTGSVDLLYEECRTYAYEIKDGKIVNLQEEPCLIFETALDRTKAVNQGSISAKAFLSVLLHKNKVTGAEETIVRATPDGAAAFTKIFFKNCLVATVEIGGAVDLLLHEGGDKVKQLVQEANLAERLSQLLYGAQNMFLDGSIWVFLTGAHLNMPWGIV